MFKAIFLSEDVPFFGTKVFPIVSEHFEGKQLCQAVDYCISSGRGCGKGSNIWTNS